MTDGFEFYLGRKDEAIEKANRESLRRLEKVIRRAEDPPRELEVVGSYEWTPEQVEEYRGQVLDMLDAQRQPRDHTRRIA